MKIPNHCTCSSTYAAFSSSDEETESTSSASDSVHDSDEEFVVIDETDSASGEDFHDWTDESSSIGSEEDTAAMDDTLAESEEDLDERSLNNGVLSEVASDEGEEPATDDNQQETLSDRCWNSGKQPEALNLEASPSESTPKSASSATSRNCDQKRKLRRSGRNLNERMNQ